MIAKMSSTDPAPQGPGRPAGASSDAAERDLRADIETALKPGARLLTLPPELEQRYQAASSRGRNRSLRTWLNAMALIDFLCIGIDALVMPEYIVEAAIARGLVLTPLYLGAAALLDRQRPPWVQGLAILVPTCSLMLVAGYLAGLAGGAHIERYLLGGLFTVFASTIVPNVALRWAAAQAALSLAIFGMVLFRLNEIHAVRSLIDNIELLTPYVVEEFLPAEGGLLGSARVRNTETGEERDLPMSGAFVAVGHVPQSEIVEGVVDTDDDGYVAVDGRSTRTRVPGMFAAGDLVDHTYRQAVTAAGSGCQAALDAEWYLRDNPHVPTPEALAGTGDLAEEQWVPHEPVRQ